MFEKIRKRDGRIVKFDSERITNAISKAGAATGEFGRDVAKKLTIKVLAIAQQVIKDRIPTVEEIQDIVEEVLMASPYRKTAKAYIIYREQHARIREIISQATTDLVNQYLNKIDWEVNENSNMSFSLQGLNNYISSKISKVYWLNKIYPEEIRKAHIEGDFHIHDLGILSVYCVGWDLFELLLQGFRGAPGKIESKPAKHFRSALGQIVNFFYTLQGEAAGAQAFSNFDTLLAPFIRYDKLSYRDIKQALQEFLFNVNVPTRVGFQCLSEDTKILTASGWKKYNEISEKDYIYTYNIKTKKIEIKKIDYIFRKHYKGIMYNLKNKNQSQLISPRHRVVRQIPGTDKFVLQPIEELLNFSSHIAIPVSAENRNKDYPISDEELRYIAWVLSKGYLEKLQGIEIGQENRSTSSKMRLSFNSSTQLCQILESNKKEFPEFLYKLSQRQAQIFLETYTKVSGWSKGEKLRIITTKEKFAEVLSAIGVLAGYNVSIKTMLQENTKTLYEIIFTSTRTEYIQSIEKVEYEGIIWSVHTENETVIACRNGQVFITGNTPFTNITLDLKPPEHFRNQSVIIGGVPHHETYGDFEEEIKLLNKAFLEVMLEGDAKGRVFTFPIPTYNITKDFDWDAEYLKPLWKVTAKYGIPYFANFINSDMKPEDARSMCCRLRLDTRKLEKKGGGLFGANPLTGSIGVVTINMPRIGYLSKNENEFFERLERLMQLAKNSLEIKRRVLEKLTEQGLYPYSKYYLRNIKKHLGAYWKNHFSTIGLVGLNEACLNLLGVTIGDSEGKNFGLKVLEFMRNKLVEFQEETGNNYNLEATPAEGTSYRLAMIDKKKYPDIICANEQAFKNGAEPFYTNSSQLPVNYTDDIFEVLDLQDELQTKYTGGTVIHIFVGEKITNSDIVKNLVKKVCENYRLPYFTITPTFSICPNHGYLSGEHSACPNCNSACEVYSRVVGYLRPISQWNKGKKEEFKIRKSFKVFTK